MTEPTRPPLAPPTSGAAPADDDVELHHRSISDDAPSPSGSAPPAPSFTSAKASASAFASKLAFGGRKLLSPLAAAAVGVAGGGGAANSGSGSSNGGSVAAKDPSTLVSPASTPSAATASADAAKLGLKGNARSSLAGATDAASAVTSSISSFLFYGSGASATATAGGATTASAATAPVSTASSASTVGSVDPAELERQEAEYRQVSAQQRMQILEDLVQHRRADWSYLKAMHGGTNYWLNIALLREQQVLAHLGERQSIRRSVQFFYLGLGLGRLISEVRHAQFMAMEGCQLLEELEFYFSSATVQSMKLMVATNTTLHEPLHKMDDEALYSVEEPFRPTIYKWNQRPVFRRLVSPPITFPLDYREVMLSLCDILALVYSKLVEDNTSSENVYLFQAIIRFDEKIKRLVIDPVKKEFSAVAANVLVEELASVRREFSSGGHHHQQPHASPALGSPTPASPTGSGLEVNPPVLH